MRTEKNIYYNEKKEGMLKVEKVEQKIQALEAEKRKQRRNIHPEYNTVELLNKGLKDLDKRMTQHTISKNEETRIMREMDQIKKSRPVFDEIEKLNQQVIELKKEKQEVYDSLAPTKKIIAQIQEKISKVQKQDDEFEDDKQYKRNDMTKIQNRLDKI